MFNGVNIEQIAELCHEVNRAYCESLGDHSQKRWTEAPVWQKESAINGVRFHLNNNATPEETHISWMREKEADGWIYGDIKDPNKKTHPCMVPYDQLPQEQRSKDYLFKAICEFFLK
ncbi:RyR domain-containing protein [Desulfosporosinus sp. FKA]|uniref:RyR domain-containing protein n=1 Tax=Desulfosporosinus sp. FKA TaxID=1969834 RepID=UPI000B499ED5|nr:RyR domain-containing protein [Desulfosporosinus sp. FKA]